MRKGGCFELGVLHGTRLRMAGRSGWSRTGAATTMAAEQEHPGDQREGAAQKSEHAIRGHEDPQANSSMLSLSRPRNQERLLPPIISSRKPGDRSDPDIARSGPEEMCRVLQR